MIARIFAWLLDLKLLNLRVDTFYFNKKTKQLSFTVPTTLVDKLGNFKPVFANVYFTKIDSKKDIFK